MRLKDNCKLASQVLETRVPYNTRGLMTGFLLAELDTIMPHRPRVLKIRVLQSKTESLRLDFLREMPLISSLQDLISTGIKSKCFMYLVWGYVEMREKQNS